MFGTVFQLGVLEEQGVEKLLIDFAVPQKQMNISLPPAQLMCKREPHSPYTVIIFTSLASHALIYSI